MGTIQFLESVSLYPKVIPLSGFPSLHYVFVYSWICDIVIIFYFLFVLLFVICNLLFVICYLLFVICYLLFVICYLLFVICYLFLLLYYCLLFLFTAGSMTQYDCGDANGVAGCFRDNMVIKTVINLTFLILKLLKLFLYLSPYLDFKYFKQFTVIFQV
jgi:hypothetical protein